MDAVSLAATALAALTSYLLGLGKIAAEESATSLGKSAFDWIKSRLTGAGEPEALADLEHAPDAPENSQAVLAALIKALKKNPDAAAALQALLASAPGGSGGLTAHVSGIGNNLGQADRGSNVTISVGAKP